jgi:Tol biopolymer transport system component
VGPTNQPPNRRLTFPVAYYYYLNNGSQIITTGQADYVPAFSPNGQQVAYVRATWIQDTSAPGLRQPSILALRVVNVDGSNDHQVIQLNQGVYVTHLSWSRDGTQLVYDAGAQLIVSGTPANLADQATDALWIINTNGTGMHNVRGPFSGLPVWSPAGSTFCNLGVSAGGGVAGSIDDCGAPLNLKGTRMLSGQYRLDISGGTSNLLYRVLASTNLTSWQTLGTTPRTSTTTSFTDAGASSLPSRFYRVVLGN